MSGDRATPRPDTVYKICTQAEWNAARAADHFYGSAVDLRDGFVHFSTADQVVDTANLHFSGQDHLVLLSVATAPLGVALRWERSRGLQEFPHLYAPLPLDAITAVHDLQLGPDGRHVFPRLA